jgi:hypothetical protein
VVCTSITSWGHPSSEIAGTTPSTIATALMP